jgi:nucleoside triphosphate diphosphatase
MAGVAVVAQIEELLEIMRRLRDPNGGCPWDVQQNFKTIAPYTIEEAYEVSDAIDRNDLNDLKEELGDLLLQVVFHAQMAKEQGAFDFNDVVASICEKMTVRHPHVFAGASVEDAEQQTKLWEEQKRREREAKNGAEASTLDGVSRGLPEWQRAVKLQKRAASVGFDWPDVNPVFEKLHEELDEVRAEFIKGKGHQALEDEIGDVLFVAANLTRHAKVDFGSALRRANQKFERRFRRMEQIAIANGVTLEQLNLQAQGELWNQAKAEEK